MKTTNRLVKTFCKLIFQHISSVVFWSQLLKAVTRN